MSRTIVEMYLNGGYKEIINMTLFECGCDKVELPLVDYYEPIDGSIEEYLEDISNRVWLYNRNQTLFLPLQCPPKM